MNKAYHGMIWEERNLWRQYGNGRMSELKLAIVIVLFFLFLLLLMIRNYVSIKFDVYYILTERVTGFMSSYERWESQWTGKELASQWIL